MNLKSWDLKESVSLSSCVGRLYWTGVHFRVLLEINHETCRALGVKKPKVLLPIPANSLEEAKGKAEFTDAILANMKEQAR